MKRILRWFFLSIIGKIRTQNFAIWLLSISGKSLITTAWNSIGILNYRNQEESGELFALEKIIKPALDLESRPVIIFDVGANVGDYTNLLMTIFGAKATIYSFEPNPNSYGELIKLNPNSYNIALGAVAGDIKMYGYQENLKATHFSAIENFLEKDKDSYSEVVSITTLNNFLSEKSIDHIDFLKIDTEGYDYDVLKGLSKSFLKTVPFIQFEINQALLDRRILVRDFYDLLSEHFNLFRLNSNDLIDISNYSHKNEIYLYQNILAINKSLREQ